VTYAHFVDLKTVVNSGNHIFRI